MRVRSGSYLRSDMDFAKVVAMRWLFVLLVGIFRLSGTDARNQPTPQTQDPGLAFLVSITKVAGNASAVMSHSTSQATASITLTHHQ